MKPDVRRIVLVGFMAAGKSTVGARLAERLGGRFVDLDDLIEARAGRTIAEIFAAEGEAAFRRLEAEATADLAAAAARGLLVIAPGGGWVAEPGLLDTVREGSVVVWLRVSAEEAVRRAASSGVTRPLLDAADPLRAARALLAAREAEYRKADFAVETDGRDVVEVVTDVVARLDAVAL